MTDDDFEKTLKEFQRRRPFKPFTVALVNGDRFQVDHPEALFVRQGVAAFIDAYGEARIFDHESVSHCSDEVPQKEASTPRYLLIASLLLASWLGMQQVHEAGHCIGAWLTGGRVTKVVLHPLTISRTDVEPNLAPLLVTWTGPILGVMLPLTIWGIAAGAKFRAAFVLRFFAGFCLVANGLYLGLGSFGKIGDCGTLLANGAEAWQLWLFGAVCVPLGFVLWNGQGKYFGLGAQPLPVASNVAYETFACAIALLMLGVVVGN